MALRLLGSGRDDIWVPSWLDSALDPFALMDNSPMKSFGQGARASASTKVDWLETKDAHIFKADLPGLKKEDVKVQLEEGRILSIYGERNQEEAKKGDTWHTLERSYGTFPVQLPALPNKMTLRLLASGRDGIWVPSWLDSAMDPFALMDDSPMKSFGQGARASASTKVDWLETKDAHIFKADLPGLKKEDVKVQLEEGRILSIYGERNQEEAKKGDTWHTLERTYGKLLRQFKLPDDANVDVVSAKVEDGVLSVTVPKFEKKKPEKRSINVA